MESSFITLSQIKEDKYKKMGEHEKYKKHFAKPHCDETTIKTQDKIEHNIIIWDHK